MEWANPPRTHGAALNRLDPPLNSHTGIRIGRRGSTRRRKSQRRRQRLTGTRTSSLNISEAKFNKRRRRMCPVTYLLDDDIDPSNTSDVLWGAGYPHPSPAPPKAMARTDSAVVSVLHRTGVTQRPIVLHDSLLPRWATGERTQRGSTRFTRSKSANES